MESPKQRGESLLLTDKLVGRLSGSIKLYYAGNDGKPKKDSAAVINGSFSFKGNLNNPVMAFLSGDVQSRADDDPNSTSFFLEPSVINISLKVNDFKKSSYQRLRKPG